MKPILIQFFAILAVVAVIAVILGISYIIVYSQPTRTHWTGVVITNTGEPCYIQAFTQTNSVVTFVGNNTTHILTVTTGVNQTITC